MQVHCVVLKSLGNINETVASGYVSEMEHARVNGEESGSDCCEIIIQSQMKKDACLLRPYGNIQTIEDSLGAPVAWPLSLVALDEILIDAIFDIIRARAFSNGLGHLLRK
ncbi:hypothetical protein BUALT_Bualt12G0066100 [Buddleja alternifolia]|uniref:Transposase Tnp1/En/Spm-like domain-containing protein n=1 Tax=Buddleja alternifolia TaxID=168488 RepID=A0AAV6WXP1_9LAMI|nr:hypothetical protein BUALT_Bualt12G0066100 [Buddleja alternifolia]